MTKRSRVVGATIMTILGIAILSLPLVGGTELKAAGVDQVGYDFTKIFIWVGVGLLVLSALLFISTNTD